MVPTCFESSRPVNICVDTERQDYLGPEVFDYLVGYWQYASDYQLTPTVIFSKPQANSYNVLFLYMPEVMPDNIDQYDLVLLDNGDEPFEYGTDVLYQLLTTVPYAKFLCNSLLPDWHPLKSKIITTNIMWEKHRRYYTESVFPQRYEFTNTNQHLDPIIYINGRNRSVREHWTRTLLSRADKVPHHNELHFGAVSTIYQCQYETTEDTDFRVWANSTYANDVINMLPPEDRWPPLPAGVAGRYGATLLEDRFIDAFRKHRTIVYPERTWLNHQVSLTEKSLKCFLHRKFPMPVSGAGVHQFYNKLGFKTAWNLLPPELQAFDDIKNHIDRYQKQAQAVNWLYDHSEIMFSEQAKSMLVDNQAQCMLTSSQAGQELYNIINENS
jgi:hypothetical protein